MKFRALLNNWLALPRRRRRLIRRAAPVRGAVDHVVILDGTMSSLTEGMETNAGLTYRLLREVNGAGRSSLLYEPGIQWDNWSEIGKIITGRGINQQIRRAYGFIASRYRPGDRIFLFGYSRGAYAVRSLAGMIDAVGLLRAEEATERNIRQIYRFYEADSLTIAARVFSAKHCHPSAPIEMVGVWDTVRALGVRLPLVWRLYGAPQTFHNHELGQSIRHGYQALALNETRRAFAPVMWQVPRGHGGEVQQVWFRGVHGDIGGHLNDFTAARPLSNIPLIWMLERAEACGLKLPADWHERFESDPNAPSLGHFRGWAKVFLLRHRRPVGRDPTEFLHPSAGRFPGLPLLPEPPRPARTPKPERPARLGRAPAAARGEGAAP